MADLRIQADGRHLTRERLKTVVVCVPVRDEAVLLPRFLEAFDTQAGAHDFALCFVFDGCTDDSEGIVAQHAARASFITITERIERAEPNAGRARRAAMTLGLAHVVGDAGVILSTDADSVVSNDWISANLRALEVADVAAGRIVRDGTGDSVVQDRVEAYYDALFRQRRRLDPVPWEARDLHHYTSGASLAFRVGAYRALGGFEPLPSAEDARLVDAAYRAGLRVRRDGAIRVGTSSRRSGRARNGLADHLARLDSGDGTAATMAHPADACWRYAGHAAARAAWGDLDHHSARLAKSLAVSVADVITVARDAPNAEAFAMRVVPDIPGGERLVGLDEAEHALAAMIERPVAA